MATKFKEVNESVNSTLKTPEEIYFCKEEQTRDIAIDLFGEKLIDNE
jgi:hypothetical protein